MIDSWPNSATRWARAKNSLGGGVSSGLRAQMKPHPLFFERGAGSRLYDVDANQYDDYVLGWGPVILGHSHPHVVDEVTKQVGVAQTFGAGHDLEYEAAERVCAAVPGVDRILWTNTGTEATQIALRLARAATGRSRFVKFFGHYHGWSDLMLRGYRPNASGELTPTGSAGQAPAGASDAVLLPWNDLDTVAEALRGGDVAAVFTEPVLCNTGVIPPAPGFLHGLRDLCDATGTLLIFDEVITGFRLSYGGAAQRYGVRADLTVLGKAIANGFTLAAVGGSAQLIGQVEHGVVHAGTYNGNPIVLRACVATLDVLRQDGTYERLEELGGRLANGFRQVLDASRNGGAVNQAGPVVQVLPDHERLGSVEEYFAGDWRRYDEMVVELLRRGVFVLPGGRWYLSTAHTPEQVDHAVKQFADAVAAVDAR